MKDLHIKLNDHDKQQLKLLAEYCRTTESKLIRSLINIACKSAAFQINYNGGKTTNYEDYLLTNITVIFDDLYPPINNKLH